MSITRARQHVQSSRALIEQQIAELARQANVDTLTMARAIQEGLNDELGEAEPTREVKLELMGTFTFEAQTDEDVEEKIEELRQAAESMGVEDFDAYEV